MVFKHARIPVKYYSQKNAWKDADIFSGTLGRFDRALGVQNRKVLLLLDNCSAHPDVRVQNVKSAKNNTTSLLGIYVELLQ